ncbi:hypothetical protein BS50DRAFT_504290 [Corynespora cassiicola Philippines]|uniref:Cyclase n=1 Tax=Corynespora cassiicola Philippines TaxID=1448308 RepID=A0A2T2N7Z0_CORCC|nr:hypothetical protein BS50DRAFT_504290 [Corynespora cassiicola Philippines]
MQNNWYSRGGIVGGTVLLDYANYEEANGVKVSPFQYHAITVQDLDNVIADQNVELRTGDILLVRTGLTEALIRFSEEEQTSALRSNSSIGLEPNRAMARWTWDHHFAAVASDNLAVEALGGNSTVTETDFPSLRESLHHWILTMFGLPIGEIWDLKGLSTHCRKTSKYSFFLTSIPLNIPGLIASPPNAIAIF